MSEPEQRDADGRKVVYIPDGGDIPGLSDCTIILAGDARMTGDLIRCRIVSAKDAPWDLSLPPDYDR